MVEDNVIKELIAKLRESLDLMHSIPNDELVDYIEASVFEYAEEHRLKTAEMKWIVERIYHAFRGYDVLQPLIDDKSITEIIIIS